MSRKSSGFTLAEVVMAVAIVALIFGSMMVAYMQATRRAQWSGYSMAAQGLAIQQLEQARSATWDPCIPTNQIFNLNLLSTSNGSASGTFLGGFYGYSWTNLDLPCSGSNYVRATNYVRVEMFYANRVSTPPVQIQMIRVDTVWPFVWNNRTNLFTNSIATFTAPDNRDPATLWQ
jgi:prepilin-type N-terminal cleavage/methylation domain-containing protein